MRTKRLVPVTLLAVGVSVGLLLSGCSSKSGGADATAAASASAAASVVPAVPPAIGSPDEVENKKVTVSLNLPLVLNVEDVTAWSGEVEDPQIAEFRAGKEEGGTVYAPGVVGLKEGTTRVTLKGPGGATKVFDVEVVADDAAVGVSE